MHKDEQRDTQGIHAERERERERETAKERERERETVFVYMCVRLHTYMQQSLGHRERQETNTGVCMHAYVCMRMYALKHRQEHDTSVCMRMYACIPAGQPQAGDTAWCLREADANLVRIAPNQSPRAVCMYVCVYVCM